MTPATRPPPSRDDIRLLVVDPRSGAVADRRFDALPALLGPGDLLVVNDAATLPASLFARGPGGADIEVRLLGPTAGERWRAVLLGAGSWRQRTEERPPPPPIAVGSRLSFAGLTASIAALSPLSPRLVELAFDRAGEALWSAIYAAGAPVQYAHVDAALPLWEVQTVYAGRPWAAEMPSAGRPLTWGLLGAIRARGAGVACLTHAAGLSSTGDPDIDAALPLPERYDIPARTVAAVDAARARGGRVIAVGTTVVRALEGAAATARGLAPGDGETDLVIGPGFVPRVVSSVLSGVHVPGESHFELLAAFAPRRTLRAAVGRAADLGYRGHELGDAMLILDGAAETHSWTSSSATASRAVPTGASTTRCKTPGSTSTPPTFAA